VLFVRILTIFCFSLSASMHPVHVSILNFEYSQNLKEADISVKVFPDDFELAFIHNYNIRLNLGKKDIHPEWEKYISLYIKKMFSLKINNRIDVPIVFKSYEVNDDGIILHFSAPIHKKVKSFQMGNGLLLDVFENQTNLVIFSVDGKEKGYSLNFSNYKINLKL
jgi:hypothetical protein